MIAREFEICDMADDLLLLTLDMCDRDSRRPRTPKRLHRLRLQNGKKKAKKRELKMVTRQLAEGEITPEKLQQCYQGWRQRVMRAGCRNVVFEMDRHFICLLHNAGYQTRTTMKKGVEIIGKSDKHD